MQTQPQEETNRAAASEKRTGSRAMIQRRLIAGIATLIPIGATIWIVGFISARVLHLFEPVTRQLWKNLGIDGGGLVRWIDAIASWIIAFLAVYLVGLLSLMAVGKRALGVGESLLRRIPVIKSIYGTVKQIVDTLSMQKSSSSQRVAVIEYPRKGMYSVGFITGEARIRDDSRVFVNVFVPATPNPTSGFLIVLPSDEVFEANMTVEEAFKFILSGGILTWDFTLKPYRPGRDKAASLPEIALNK